SGLAPASVVRTTGLPIRDEFREGVDSGVLVSRGMFDRVLPHGVHFPGQDETSQTGTADGLGPSASDRLPVPEAWAPLPTERVDDVDVIYWNTGFRAALKHLEPLHLRTRDRGIAMDAEVAARG